MGEDTVSRMVAKPPEDEFDDIDDEPDALCGPVLKKGGILDADDTDVCAVNVPEWGGAVYVRVLSGGERDAFEASLRDPRTGKNTRLDNFRARFASLVLANEDGSRMFDDRDASELSRKSAKALDRILEAGLATNGMDDASVEDAEKN